MSNKLGKKMYKRNHKEARLKELRYYRAFCDFINKQRFKKRFAFALLTLIGKL